MGVLLIRLPATWWSWIKQRLLCTNKVFCYVSQDKSQENLGSTQLSSNPHIHTKQWMAGEPGYKFDDWKVQAARKPIGPKTVGNGYGLKICSILVNS